VTKTILPLEAPNAPLFTLARRLRRFVRLVLEKPLTLPLMPRLDAWEDSDVYSWSRRRRASKGTLLRLRRRGLHILP
jgi:hypothetical protein